MHLFSTHPDVQQRRQRLETALGSFWSEPVVVGNSKVLKIKSGQEFRPSGRRSKGRYIRSYLGPGAAGFDEQNREYVTWVPQASVTRLPESQRGLSGPPGGGRSRGEVWDH